MLGLLNFVYVRRKIFIIEVMVWDQLRMLFPYMVELGRGKWLDHDLSSSGCWLCEIRSLPLLVNPWSDCHCPEQSERGQSVGGIEGWTLTDSWLTFGPHHTPRLKSDLQYFHLLLYAYNTSFLCKDNISLNRHTKGTHLPKPGAVNLSAFFYFFTDLYLCSRGRQILWDSQTHLQDNHVSSTIASQIWKFRRNADWDVLKANIQNAVLHCLRTWNKIGFQHRMLVIAVIVIFTVHVICQTLIRPRVYNPWSCKTVKQFQLLLSEKLKGMK